MQEKSVVLLAPLNEEGIMAVASYGLGIFSQACPNRCPELLLQLPGVALGSGCRILHPQFSAKHGVFPLTADSSGFHKTTGYRVCSTIKLFPVTHNSE